MLYSSGEKLKVIQVELESLDLIIHEMGIYFVKHLKVTLTYSCCFTDISMSFPSSPPFSPIQ